MAPSAIVNHRRWHSPQNNWIGTHSFERAPSATER